MAAQDRVETLLTTPTQLGTATTVLFTVASARVNIVKQIIITNTDTVDRTFSLSIGVAGTAANRLISTLPIGANDIMVFDTALVLTAAQTFEGLADTASKVNVTIVGWVKEV